MEDSESVTLEEQIPSTKPFIKKPLSKKIIVLIASIVILVISLSYGSSIYNNRIAQLAKVSKIRENIKTVSLSEKTNTVDLLESSFWVLKKNVNGLSQPIIKLCNNCLGEYIEQWNDWIFYPSYENSSIQINGYNFTTEETKNIFDLSQHTGDFQSIDKRLPSELSDLQVIDDTLFFSLGGYLRPGGIFWADLPPISKPKKLTDSLNANITYWKNRYWIVGGEGDACWSYTDYSLIDLAAKKVKHIASSTSGCYDGEEFVDIDKHDRMILAYHAPDFGDEYPADKDNGIYQYVTAVSLSNPSVKEEVIAKQDMPTGVTSVIYLEDNDQLFLSGKENYLYNFSSKSITRTDTLIPTPKPLNIIKYVSLEDKIKKIKLPGIYEFVLE